MSDVLEGVRLGTTITVYGETLDELYVKALSSFKAFFGTTPFEITEIRAEPLAQTMMGDVVTWRGSVEAGEVWSV